MKKTIISAIPSFFVGIICCSNVASSSSFLSELAAAQTEYTDVDFHQDSSNTSPITEFNDSKNLSSEFTKSFASIKHNIESANKNPKPSFMISSPSFDTTKITKENHMVIDDVNPSSQAFSSDGSSFTDQVHKSKNKKVLHEILIHDPTDQESSEFQGQGDYDNSSQAPVDKLQIDGQPKINHQNQGLSSSHSSSIFIEKSPTEVNSTFRIDLDQKAIKIETENIASGDTQGITDIEHELNAPSNQINAANTPRQNNYLGRRYHPRYYRRQNLAVPTEINTSFLDENVNSNRLNRASFIMRDDDNAMLNHCTFLKCCIFTSCIIPSIIFLIVVILLKTNNST